jgi:hypothetical protein
MRHSRSILSVFFWAPLLLSALSYAQPWSGIINSSRAADWTTTGVAIPSGSWKQCGATITAYGSSGSPASPTTINSAVAGTGTGYTGCTKPYVILLGAGDFYLNGGITLTSNVVLRGQGANSTRLHFSAVGGCNGWNAAICVAGSNTYDAGGYTQGNWTGGLGQGSKSITLDNVSGIVVNLTPIVLDQCNTGFTGNTSNGTCTGTAVDNNNLYVCEVSGVCSSQGANTGLHRSNRAQEDVVVATSCTATTGTCTTGTGPYTLTLQNPISWPGWTAGQNPQAWWGSSTITNAGVEDFGIDDSTLGQRGVSFLTAYQCWAKGITTTTTNYYSVFNYITSHNVVRDSYFYWTYTASQESYGIGGGLVGDLLMENNIMQGITDPINFDSQCSRCVAGYNFALNQYDTTSAYMFPMVSFHSAGVSDVLLEGNIGSQADPDNIWGTHTLSTEFRNYFNGYESNNGTMPTDNTEPMHLAAFSRYFNLIGNVLGNPLHHTTYQCLPSAASTSQCSDVATGKWTHVYDLGWSGNTHGKIAVGGSPNDLLTASTTMRWGNYDVVTKAVRWCGGSSDTGFSSTCGSASEIPTSDSYYPNSIPTVGDTGAGMSRLPSSFYNGVIGQFASCGTGISYWKNPTTGTCPPYPPIGPDVSGGSLLVCSSGPYQYSVVISSNQCAGGTSQPATGGFSYANPAMACYLNTMNGTPDGTGSMLSFNRASCYASDASSQVSPAAPTGLVGIPH